MLGKPNLKQEMEIGSSLHAVPGTAAKYLDVIIGESSKHFE